MRSDARKRLAEHPAEKDASSTSIQHRCPRMREHLQGGCTCHPTLPIPCPDCYSVRVTTERLPYRKSEPWTRVTPPAKPNLSTAAALARVLGCTPGQHETTGTPCQGHHPPAIYGTDGCTWVAEVAECLTELGVGS